MFMWVAIFAFIFAVFSLVIYLGFKDDADAGKSKLAVKINLYTGFGAVMGVILMIIFFFAAVIYE